MSLRSTTGCYTCKSRKKKCDETKPHCLRCIRSRRECEGYAPLENPDRRGVMRRAKVGPAGAAQSRPQLKAGNLREQQPSSNLEIGVDTALVSQLPSTQNTVSFLPPEVIWYTNDAIHTSLLPVERPPNLASSSYTSLDTRMTGGVILSYSLVSNEYLSDEHDRDPPAQTRKWLNSANYPQLAAPDWYHRSILEVDEEGDQEQDPGIKQEMCVVPVLDPNTPDNTLPFILQCYARWISLVLFEPSRGAHPMKENLVNKFISSPGERPRIILLANAIGSLSKGIKPNPKAAALVTYLSTGAYQHLNKFISVKPANDREKDRQDSLAALDLLMEVILIKLYFHSVFSIVKFLQAVAPIFRRACPEPMDQYVNLPRAIMSPDINIKNFATNDVILSVTTGRPMLFRYDVTCPPDIRAKLKDGGHGMQWLHGVADEYIIILARINVLAEELGLETTISVETVAEIERQIRTVESVSEPSSNPISMIWKFTMQECWRLSVFLYLYMASDPSVLCRTSTDDLRVLKCVKSYVRLLKAIKPGRNPDAFLYLPTIIVGVSAYDKQDRMFVQRRMVALQEYTDPGSAGYDIMKILADLWTRVDAENRGALWSDFRMSTFWITGV